jgi:hypothetical protein
LSVISCAIAEVIAVVAKIEAPARKANVANFVILFISKQEAYLL